MRAIRFLLPWRGKAPGDVVATFTPGVADALVRRRVAAYHDAAPAEPPAAPPRPARRPKQP